LREKPRKVLPSPAKSSLPAVPDVINISPQFKPFVIPEQYEELEEALVKPVREFLKNMPLFPSKAVSAHPFKGGEVAGHQRLNDVILHGVATGYKDTRNGLLGVDFSTKLSAYLAQGSLTARQIHHELRGFEDGTAETFRDVDGFGKGEVAGTKGIREELLWRDYMRLYHKKINDKLFQVKGVRDYKDPDKKPQWKTGDREKAGSG
jgi:deoxyribodipyrimidine photo-lyase